MGLGVCLVGGNVGLGEVLMVGGGVGLWVGLTGGGGGLV